MRRRFILVWAILFAVLLGARGEGPDDKYVQIYTLIQEADSLNEAGQTRDAALKYLEAQKTLKSLQTQYPDWNGGVVNFRLAYLASKLEPLTQKLTPTNAPPAIAEKEASGAGALTNQLKKLQQEIKQLTDQNGLLEAKLKEALSVQPAPLDPHEFAKAEEQIRQLQKEKELLKVSLEQEKAKGARPVDAGILEQERQILADVEQKLAQQTELATGLKQENDSLKKLLESKSAPEPTGPNNDLAQQLQLAKATVASLQASNLSLRAEQILLESRVADLAKHPMKGNRSSPRPEPQNQQLEVALARLAVYEAKVLPYTPEELALFKQPDLKVNLTGTGAAPVKRTIKELPPGAGPIMEEGRRAFENGRLDEAEKKFLEVLRQDDKNIYTLGLLAAVQLEQNRLADAEKTISQALVVDPRDPACLFTMGLLKYRQEKYDEALDALSLSAKLIPEEPRTQYYLGKTLIQKGNRTAAEAALRKAVHLRPGWGDAHYSLAMVYATQQPPFKELAQWHYQKAIASGYPRNLEFEKLLDEKVSSK